MSAIFQTEEYTIANNTSLTLDVDNNISYYVFKGTATLSTGNYSVNTGSAATNGKVFFIWYKARATYQGYSVNFFGTVLTQELALSDQLIMVKGNGTDFDLVFLKDFTDFYTGYKGVGTYSAVLGGDTKTLNPKVDKQALLITGNGTLLGSTTIDSTSEVEGDQFLIIYNATLTLNSNNFTILGLSLTEQEALSGDLSILATYDGSTWKTSLMSGQGLSPSKATQAQAETGSDNTTYMTPLTTSQKLAHWLLNSNKTTSVQWTFSNATPITLSALTANYALELNGSKQVVSVAKNTGYNLNLGTSGGTIMEGNDTRVINGQFEFWVSFESGEKGTISFDMIHGLTLTSAYIRVTGDLAATDQGTITITNGGSAITGGTQNIPASTPFGTDYSIVLSGATAIFNVGDNLRVTTSKITSGGRALVVLYYTLS